MMRNFLALPGLAFGGLLALGHPGDPAADWNVDASHTEINFSVRHFFTPVSGSFHAYEIELDFDPERPERSSVKVEVDVASIDTGNEKRDDHLRSADWFDAARHPHIRFESSTVRQVGEDRYLATGTLTIKETRRKFELPITLLGIQDIPEPMRPMLGGISQVASFEAAAELDRRDFGVGVGSWAETAIVGSEVRIAIAVEVNRS